MPTAASNGSSAATSTKSSKSSGTKISISPESEMSVATPSHIANTEIWLQKRGLLPKVTDDRLLANIGRESVEHFMEKYADIDGKDMAKQIKDTLKTTKTTTIDPECVRNVANWSSVESHNKFDKSSFDPYQTSQDVELRSPKLAKLIQNIERLDKLDQAKYGRKFKHFIFSDIKTAQGAKAVASALLANGYHLGYNVKPDGKIVAKPPEELKLLGNRNFFLLSSVSIYGEPLRVAVKKDVLKKFNQRTENVYGDLARIIVMDSGFKEGIDLFDIKYVHIFEPQTTLSDQKQVIGRGTRTCGQKGLHFKAGWPLYVFKYDLTIAEKYRPDFRGAESAFAYYLLSKNVDLRQIRLASNLEELAIKGSVDYNLNRNIHLFSADGAELSKGGKTPYYEDNDDETYGDDKKRQEDNILGPRQDDNIISPRQEDNILILSKIAESKRPGEKHKAIQRYIDTHFSQYKWDKVQMENLCGYEGPEKEDMKRVLTHKPQNPRQLEKRRATLGGAGTLGRTETGGAPTLIKMSPTQEFISRYFTASNPIKGMVLWQSVGTGKTCTAIATATRQFEPKGYTILWVTRTTLKNDIWKNMFDMVCHEGIRELVESGGETEIPEEQKDRMKLLSNSWGVRPISYKQFSNLVSKNNQYYDKLVKRNGEEDPLRKTLIIIDEAHKLYGGGDLSSIERPNMPEFHKALMNSYAVSGADSARVMLMTATPITENPLELIKLINLCRPVEKQLATEFETFADKYLDDIGDFTEIGEKLFLDDIAGHLSYLNREGDVRQFARPILREVSVPLVDKKMESYVEKFNVIGLNKTAEDISALKDTVNVANEKYQKMMAGITKTNASKVASVCNEYPASEQENCRKIAKKYASRVLKTAKERGVEWKSKLAEYKQALKGANAAKLSRVHFTRNMRKEHPDLYEKYQKSSYYKLKECEQKQTDTTDLDAFLETLPEYNDANQLQEAIKTEMRAIDNQLKMGVLAETARIRSYQQLLKTDLSALETQVVRRSILAAKTRLQTTRERNMKWLKRATKRADSSLTTLKNFMSLTRKLVTKELRNTASEMSKMEKTEARAKQLEEDADEDLQDEFLESIQEAKSSIREELMDLQYKRNEKMLLQTTKAQNAEQKKAAKVREAAEKKAAKEKDAAEKKAAKEREAAEKRAAKEREAAEKRAAKAKEATKAKNQEASEKRAAKTKAVRPKTNVTRKKRPSNPLAK